MSLSHAPGHIAGFIAIRRERAAQRWRTARDYLALAAVVALLLFGTGAVQILADPPAPSTRIVVDILDCPPLTEASLPIVSFTITMRGDGTPESQGCTRWQKRIQVRRQKNV